MLDSIMDCPLVLHEDDVLTPQKHKLLNPGEEVRFCFVAAATLM